jgi:predicted permease
MVAVLARYASRFSVRALDLTVDSSMLWVSAGLALIAAVVLAFVPRLPLANTSQGISLASGGVRITGNTTKRLRAFAITQIAASFILLAGASMLLKTLLSLQKAQSGFDTHNVLAINVPAVSYGKTPEQVIDFYQETMRRIRELPGVDNAAFGLQVPWRDAGAFGPGFQFEAEGHVQPPGEEDPRAQLRTISPGFFSTLRVPIVAGRDFNDADRKDGDSVVMISQTFAQRIFPNQDPINRHIMWTDPIMKFINIAPTPRRIIGVAADIDDEHIVAEPTLTVYSPFQQGLILGGRLFIHTHTDPYALVTPVTRIIRNLSADQPIEHAATLDDVRAEVLTPDRLNTFVFGGFAAVALTIAVVGVAGVLAFSVSGRIREFGIRLALGSQPRDLLMGVITEGAIIATVGVVAGAILGGALTRVAGTYLFDLEKPSALPLIASGFVLLASAVIASLLPAARAARVDVMQALRTE